MAVLCDYILADTSLSSEVLSMLYGCVMCLHMCRFMPLYRGIEYIIWLCYVSTCVPIYASLQRYWVHYMSAVCLYIRADICLSLHMWLVCYDYGMYLRMWRNMPLYIRGWYVIWLWYVSTYLRIHISLQRCWVCVIWLWYVSLYVSTYAFFSYVIAIFYGCVMCIVYKRYWNHYKALSCVLIRFIVCFSITALVCYMAVVHFYKRTDICFFLQRYCVWYKAVVFDHEPGNLCLSTVILST